MRACDQGAEFNRASASDHLSSYVADSAQFTPQSDEPTTRSDPPTTKSLWGVALPHKPSIPDDCQSRINHFCVSASGKETIKEDIHRQERKWEKRRGGEGRGIRVAKENKERKWSICISGVAAGGRETIVGTPSEIVFQKYKIWA